MELSPREISVILASLLVMVSYCTCIVITIAQGTYIGGLTFPYFSDTGREGVSYYAFAILNTCASVALIFFVSLQYRFLSLFEIMGTSCLKCLNIIATIFGILAPIGAITLSIVSTNQSGMFRLL